MSFFGCYTQRLSRSRHQYRLGPSSCLPIKRGVTCEDIEFEIRRLMNRVERGSRCDGFDRSLVIDKETACQAID